MKIPNGEAIINVIAGVLLVLEGAKDDYNKDHQDGLLSGFI